MITFIISSINRETIDRAINSLLNQTNPNWKCIIVYDGVKGKEYDDIRIKTINIEKNQSNGSPGLVRNFGIELVDTEWIGFLDDDDTLHEDYVKTLLEKYYEKDFIIWRMKYENGFILPEMGRKDLVFGRVGISFCYKKNTFSKVFFNNNKNGEDYDFIKELERLSTNWVITEGVYYNVRH